MLYKQIRWWPNAFHVHDGIQITPQTRVGIVYQHPVRINGVLDRVVWSAMNIHCTDVPGEFRTRSDAAKALPRGPIHQPIEAFSGKLS